MTGPDTRQLDGFLSALLDDDADELYEQAPCGYLSTAADGTVIKANGTFLAMTGYDRADVIGKKRFVQLLTAGGRIYHETHYAPMLQLHGAAREIALDLVRPGDSPLPVLVNAVADRHADGAIGVVRVAIFDARHRREYERELLRAKQHAESAEAAAQALARTLQATLIPPTPATIPGLQVAARYRPAGDGAQVGGDFYDVFPVGGDEWVVAIGDVCGKGPEAAVVTALARYTLRAAVVEHQSPADALRTVNEVLRQYADGRMCSVACLRLRRGDSGWTGYAASGGHPLPLLRRGDRVTPLGCHGTLLGVFAEPRIDDAVITLEPGDLLVLYTDGVPEARADGEFYGDERVLAKTLEHFAPDGLADALVADALAFQAGVPRDDIAVVAIGVGADVAAIA